MANLVLTNRQELSLTGIKKVKTTEPTSIVAVMENSLILIKGSNLSVLNLSIKDELLDITGVINSITYTTNQAKRFSLRNLFK